MNKKQAIAYALGGTKICRPDDWNDGEYMVIDKNGDFIDEHGRRVETNVLPFDGWEIYNENFKSLDEVMRIMFGINSEDPKAKCPTEMTRLEAIRAMTSGAKVKHKFWRRECHVFMTENGEMLTEDMYPFPINDSPLDGWVIYEEQVKQAGEPVKKTITLETWLCQLEGADGYEKLTATEDYFSTAGAEVGVKRVKKLGEETIEIEG